MPPVPASGGAFAFGPYRLDVRSRRLVRDGEPVVLTDRQFTVLYALLSRPGEVLPKDALIKTVWKDVAVDDGSLTQLVFHLRRLLDASDPERYIASVRRIGYQFAAPVTQVSVRHSDDELDALLAPHRALIDGRAALETLEREEIRRARATLEPLLAQHGDEASVRVALANACVLLFESTRADPAPDIDALRLSETHAREACRLDPEYAEAWATLGFVLERTGARADALAALRHAAALEPDNWRHQLRLSSGSWGEERLRAARRTLALMPDLPLARWLSATVYVARDALADAEHEIDAGIAAMPAEANPAARFSAVALHWLKGLLCAARGADDDALASFERELALESRGHLYARECAANTWYAMGAVRLRRGDTAGAREAFGEAIARVPSHPMAHAGLALVEQRSADDSAVAAPPHSVESALACAARLVAAGDASSAAGVVSAALSTAPPGNAGWLVPIEPLLDVPRAHGAWAPVLAVLRARAA